MSNILLTFSFTEEKKIYAYLIEGKKYFIAKYVCDVLEYANSSDTLKRHCKKTDGGVVKKYVPTNSGFQEMTLINSANLLRLIMKSKMEKAVEFQDWVVEKVLPSIFETGSYSIFDNNNTLQEHSSVENQKNNSKAVNSINYNLGGAEKIKDYNTQSCLIHTGLTPKKVIEIGKQKGLKSKDTSSAKQVLRALKPEIACTMSLADSLIKSNPQKTLEDISQVTKKAISVYEEMFKIDIIPIEFKK